MSANTCISIKEDHTIEYKKMRVALKKRGESIGDFLVRKWVEENFQTTIDKVD